MQNLLQRYEKGRWMIYHRGHPAAFLEISPCHALAAGAIIGATKTEATGEEVLCRLSIY